MLMDGRVPVIYKMNQNAWKGAADNDDIDQV